MTNKTFTRRSAPCLPCTSHFPRHTHCNLKPVLRGPVLAGASPSSLWKSSVSPHGNMNAVSIMPTVTSTVGSGSIGVAMGKKRTKCPQTLGISFPRPAHTVVTITAKSVQPLSWPLPLSLFPVEREMAWVGSELCKQMGC